MRRNLSLPALTLLLAAGHLASQGSGSPPRSTPVPLHAADAAPAASPAPRLRLLAPAYFYPDRDRRRMWTAMADAARQVPITAILNPASGPGRAGAPADPNYRSVLAEARAAGVKLIGYVSTDYARRPAAVVTAEVDRYHQLYPGLHGIFFDEQVSAAAQLPYYRGLYQHVKGRNPGALVVTNPGTTADVAYLDRPASDLMCLFEQASGFDTYQPPGWLGAGRRQSAAALCYNIADATAMRRCLDLALQRHLGWIYVTDDSGANPWDRLPSYWKEEVAAVHERNLAAHRLPP
jgi:hypothetical protein